MTACSHFVYLHIFILLSLLCYSTDINTEKTQLTLILA